jgi:hypothetical protein
MSSCTVGATVDNVFLELPFLYLYSENIPLVPIIHVGRDSAVTQQLVKGWIVRGYNPGGSKFFRTRPDRYWGPPSIPYNG